MTVATDVSRLIGRDAIVETLSAVVHGAAGAPPALVVVGPAGIGKTALLRHVVSLADGVHVAWLPGASSSSAHARLARALWPLRASCSRLPSGFRHALQELFDGGTTSSSRAPLLADAITALLETAAESVPIVLVVDDVDQFEDETRHVLVTVAAHMAGPRARVIVTARRGDVFGGLARSIDTVDVPPLSPARAAELLDVQPRQPDRSVRGEIIRWSRGNPLALIEYAKAYGRTMTRTFHGTTMNELAEIHPVFVNQIAALPADTRKLLVIAAAATGFETVDVINRAAGYADDFTHWQPARAAGIVEFTDDRQVIFADALVRSAAYADGDLGAQRSAHTALAADPELKDSLRAWHLAAAAPGPDECIADALEKSAVESLCLGADLELARALQRSAEMSPRRTDAARRYAQAASAANYGGDPDWALALTEVPLAESDDPDVTGFAALTRASILLQQARPVEAVETVRSVLDGRRPTDAHVTMALLYAAAGAAYYTGELGHRRDLGRWLRVTDVPTTSSPFFLPFPVEVAPLQRAYVAMYADTAYSAGARPLSFDREWTRPQAGSPRGETARRLITGVMAYATEQTALAALELGGAVEDLADRGRLRGFGFALAPLAWTLLDAGRWEELTHLLADAESVVPAAATTLVGRELTACTAQLLAFRGDFDAAAAAVQRARCVPPGAAAAPRATDVALMRAAGWMAVAAGDFEEAYRQFRTMFLTDANPAHFVVSYRGVAEMAWAASRCGRTEEAQPVLAEIGRHVMTKPPTRMRLLQHQAMALAATGQRAEHHYKLSVFDPAGEEWPLDRARARLHYGEWLRRARRPAEARLLLGAALDVFDRLGAAPLADIARSELRAAGVTGVTAAEPAPRDALQGLTAQERQIVALAASGLTNREIADRLKLSPRTVASHLYHVYPKLGVTRRHELREFTS